MCWCQIPDSQPIWEKCSWAAEPSRAFSWSGRFS